MNATEILVVILSSVLVILLVLSIVLAVILIKITLQIKKVTESAERTVNAVELAISNTAKTTGKMALGRMLFKTFKAISKKKVSK